MLCLILLGFIMSSFCLAANYEAKVASLVRADAFPGDEALSTLKTSSLIQCAVHCLKTTKCMSFSYGDESCRILAKRYPADDASLKLKKGTNYYQFSDQKKKCPPSDGELQYTAFKEKLTFAEAQKACGNKYKNAGRLACIFDQETQNKVESAIEKSNYDSAYIWIGMSGRVNGPGESSCEPVKEDHELRWVDGKMFYDTQDCYSNFHKCDPNMNGDACVGMLLTNEAYGIWVDYSCNYVIGYVCQYSGKSG